MTKNKIFHLFFFIFLSTSSFANFLDVDQFLRTIDLKKLINQDKIRNLEAQLTNPLASTHNINDLNDFVAIGVNPVNSHTTIIEFNDQQQILNQEQHDQPWIGVGDFAQNEIPAMTLQTGLESVQTCMLNQGHSLSGEITRLIIYKVLQTNQIVYDYVFKPTPKSVYCEEFLYTPDTGQCQAGMRVVCHHTVQGNE